MIRNLNCTTYQVLFILLFISLPSYALRTASIFCHECYNEESNTRINTPLSSPLPEPSPEDQEIVSILQKFEFGLDSASSYASKIRPNIIGSGSTGLGFTIEPLKGYLIRRLAGFYSFEDAEAHIGHIDEYRKKLHRLGISTTDTQLVAIEMPKRSFKELITWRYGAVYIVQPYLKSEQLAHKFLRTASKEDTQRFFHKQLQVTTTLARHNKQNPMEKLGIDPVMNNWEIHKTGNDDFDIRLNDLGQPLFTRNGKAVYDLYDQALSIIWPVTYAAWSDIFEGFQSLLKPRVMFTQMLWGYEVANLQHREHYWFNRNQCDSHLYPEWMLSEVNRKLIEIEEDPISQSFIFKAFKRNNHSIACLHKWRNISFYLRVGIAPITNNIYLKKPGDVQVDMYQTTEDPYALICPFESNKAEEEHFCPPLNSQSEN